MNDDEFPAHLQTGERISTTIKGEYEERALALLEALTVDGGHLIDIGVGSPESSHDTLFGVLCRVNDTVVAFAPSEAIDFANNIEDSLETCKGENLAKEFIDAMTFIIDGFRYAVAKAKRMSDASTPSTTLH